MWLRLGTTVTQLLPNVNQSKGRNDVREREKEEIFVFNPAKAESKIL